MQSDMEFLAKRMRTELARQQSDTGQTFVPVSVFEEIIIHLSRRLDNFEQRLYQLETGNTYSEDMLKLIRDEYKTFASVFKTSEADSRNEIELASRQIKQLEKAINMNTTFINDMSAQVVQRDELQSVNRQLSDQIDSLSVELQQYVNSSNKNNQFMVLKTKEIELVLESIRSQVVQSQLNNVESKETNALSLQNLLQQSKGQSEQTVQQLQLSIEREFEWIKSNLIKVIDLVIQQSSIN